MSTETNASRQTIHDKIESQVKAAQARLQTMKANAGLAKAEIDLIADLVTAKQAIDRKLADLKRASQGTYQQAKTDVETRVAELEKSVQTLEARLTAAQQPKR